MMKLQYDRSHHCEAERPIEMRPKPFLVVHPTVIGVRDIVSLPKMSITFTATT